MAKRLRKRHFLGRTSTQDLSSMTVLFPGVYQLGFPVLLDMRMDLELQYLNEILY